MVRCLHRIGPRAQRVDLDRQGRVGFRRLRRAGRSYLPGPSHRPPRRLRRTDAPTSAAGDFDRHHRCANRARARRLRRDRAPDPRQVADGHPRRRLQSRHRRRTRGGTVRDTLAGKLPGLPVETGHVMWSWSEPELQRLGSFLADRGLCGPTVTAQAIGDGHSNLTFLVSDGHSKMVVRRPPPPPLPPGAHDVLREARLLAALARTDVPTPRVLATVAAGELLDVPVFVMDFVDGTVITESTPAPSDDERLRRRIGESLVDTLAALHNVDWVDVGLGDFGKPDGFNARQLRRMRSLIAADGAVPSSFAPLDEWLHAHVPPESATSVVHNDFRVGNMIVDIGTGLVVAVLDWELATIGDPLADLGYLLTSYPVAGEPLVPTSAMGTAVLEPGYPGRAELLDRYADRTGADVSSVNWYATFAMYKLAALYEYSRRRFRSGVGDPYYADPDLVTSFLAAGERLAADDSTLT